MLAARLTLPSAAAYEPAARHRRAWRRLTPAAWALFARRSPGAGRRPRPAGVRRDLLDARRQPHRRQLAQRRHRPGASDRARPLHQGDQPVRPDHFAQAAMRAFLPAIAGFGLQQPGRYAALFLGPSTTFGYSSMNQAAVLPRASRQAPTTPTSSNSPPVPARPVPRRRLTVVRAGGASVVALPFAMSRNIGEERGCRDA
jgi:hypothetical protein